MLVNIHTGLPHVSTSKIVVKCLILSRFLISHVLYTWIKCAARHNTDSFSCLIALSLIFNTWKNFPGFFNMSVKWIVLSAPWHRLSPLTEADNIYDFLFASMDDIAFSTKRILLKNLLLDSLLNWVGRQTQNWLSWFFCECKYSTVDDMGGSYLGSMMSVGPSTPTSVPIYTLIQVWSDKNKPSWTFIWVS